MFVLARVCLAVGSTFFLFWWVLRAVDLTFWVATGSESPFITFWLGKHAQAACQLGFSLACVRTSVRGIWNLAHNTAGIAQLFGAPDICTSVGRRRTAKRRAAKGAHCRVHTSHISGPMLRTTILFTIVHIHCSLSTHHHIHL